jgi:hypothetical protein
MDRESTRRLRNRYSPFFRAKRSNNENSKRDSGFMDKGSIATNELPSSKYSVARTILTFPLSTVRKKQQIILVPPDIKFVCGIKTNIRIFYFCKGADSNRPPRPSTRTGRPT